MGHYDDQREYESPRERAAREQRLEDENRRREHILAYIKRDIMRRGVEEVLTDIVVQAVNYRDRAGRV